jgi:hypothetical protein
LGKSKLESWMQAELLQEVPLVYRAKSAFDDYYPLAAALLRFTMIEDARLLARKVPGHYVLYVSAQTRESAERIRLNLEAELGANLQRLDVPNTYGLLCQPFGKVFPAVASEMAATDVAMNEDVTDSMILGMADRPGSEDDYVFKNNEEQKKRLEELRKTKPS